MTNEQRIATEKRIVVKTVECLLAAGLQVSVCDGEDTTLKNSNDKTAIIAALFTTDDDYLFVRADSGAGRRMVHFVYGNDGWDVINDYSVSLETVIKPALKLAESLDK